KISYLDKNVYFRARTGYRTSRPVLAGNVAIEGIWHAGSKRAADSVWQLPTSDDYYKSST
ncbi:MAG TPA: hypothetical protein DCY27_14595, partial [Desulfobacterales bacterium]|nr:hypothetical protein [Desulfobacterales bacterium]